MEANGGLITQTDLATYRPQRRTPIKGNYRGHEIISMPPSSTGGTALVQMLNILEGYDLAASGFGSAGTVHLMTEAMRRAFADRARYVGDPDFNPVMPLALLRSKSYAERLRHTIRSDRASASSPTSFEWPAEGQETDPPIGRRRRPSGRVPNLYPRTVLRVEDRCARHRFCSTTKWATSTRHQG